MFKYLYANELMDLGFEEEAIKYAMRRLNILPTHTDRGPPLFCQFSLFYTLLICYALFPTDMRVAS